MSILAAPPGTDPTPALRDAVTGIVAGPGEPGYDRATPWRLDVSVEPRAVVVATTAADVSATMRVAAAYGFTVAVASTGHGALPIDESSILVVTSALTGCTVDAQARTARIGAGVRWQEVIDLTAPHGLTPIVGSAPDVGVAGFLTGGGVGPLVRSVGLASDRVRSFDLVTGTGEQLHVTPAEHPDLFWGLCGGKGTLGIVTEVEIELLPITHFYGGALYFDGADAPSVLRAWQQWSANLPAYADTSIAFLQLPDAPAVPPPLAGKFTVAVRYATLTDQQRAEHTLAPMRAVAEPIVDSIGETPYSEIRSVHSDPVDPMPAHERHTLLSDLTVDGVETLLATAGPDSGSPQAITEVRLLGGALSRSDRPSAFCHRTATYSLLLIGVLAPAVADAVPVHSAAVMDAMAPWSTGRELPNFSPAADPAGLARCYDEATIARLAALAEDHDPAGVLRVGHVVRTHRA